MNYKDKETHLLTCSIGGHRCYDIKPQKTIEILKIFNFYQEEFASTGEEVLVEEYDWGEEEGGIGK